MKRLLYLVLIVWIAITGTVLAILTEDLDKAVKHADRTIVDLDYTVRDTRQKVDDTSKNVNAALIQIGLITDLVREEAYAEREHWSQASVETQKTARALRQLIDRTDRQLNSGLLPAATRAVVSGQADAESLSRSGTSALAYIATAAADMDNQARNPAVSQTLQNLQLTTASLAKSMADIQARVHEVTRPKKWYMRAAWGAIDVLSKLGALLGGL